MSYKRFECVFKEHETKNSWSMIKDNQLDKPLYIKDVVDLLNEQQDTISQLQDLCGESDSENAKLRIENKKLKEENEQLKFELKRICNLECENCKEEWCEKK